jgi:excisionase family DNA binding protein
VPARTTSNSNIPELMTPGEVATAFRVAPRTVTKWADAGRLDTFRTIGGHRRYKAAQVQALLDASRQDRS